MSYLKLCDFGISKQLNTSVEKTGTQLGSPHYAAPEIFNGHEYTFTTDIWSLGITVLEIYRLSPPKLESWRIAGSDDSAWNRWLSAVLDTVQTLPQDLDLLKWQLCKDPKLRWTAARLVSGLMKQHSAQAEPDSTGVARVGNMKKRTLDPRSISERRGKKNN
jgi:serine/threonine protein kinase